MRYIFIFGISLFILFASCKKDETTPEPITKANITGTVKLFDESTTELNRDGMIISIDGSDPVISTISNTDGTFTFENIEYGNYDLGYSKTGFGTYKIFGIIHSGGTCGCSTTITETPSLGMKSTTRINSISTNTSGQNVSISLSTTPASSAEIPRYIRLFLSTESTVSYKYYSSFTEINEIKSEPAEIILSMSDLNKFGFNKGTTVYLVAYGDSFQSNEYLDPNQNKTIFPNINTKSPSPVSFVVP